ncbi:endonuclease NucS [Oxalobacteraceae bacterium R-40]|uniref:Endonuclease NucS n=1 Tax=Keguizhuia sedimenti TaxID=3064264 RepID=A0ABU1BIW0_9BURK|nr:endonuclease NucS [Oxalobacteraceae bacterium R-40]
MAAFIIVRPTADGGVQLYPMKDWLRQHPEFVPFGMDATHSTSRQLLGGLKKLGWKFEETPTEVRLSLPNESIDPVRAASVFPEDDENAALDETAQFGLERQLRDFLADNIESIPINGKKLRLFVDPTGRDGVEFPTAVGFIDVLAVDAEKNFYVFELKRDEGSDKVVGQLARYMGWVKATIGAGKEVNGVIVAKTIDPKLRYAASVVLNVSLFEYQVQFFLHPAGELPAT